MILLIIVQILVESLPVSSSGHSVLIHCLFHKLGRALVVPSRALIYVAHVPTVGIASFFLRKRGFFLVRHVVACRKSIVRLLCYGLFAEIITATVYMLGGTMINIPLWVGFVITAVALASVSWIPLVQQRVSLVTLYGLLGFAQGCAAMPGVSRLGITYTVGRWCGLSPRHAFYAAWTLAIPLYTGAFLMSVVAEPSVLQVFIHEKLMLAGVVAGASALFYLAYYLIMRRYELFFAVYLVGVAGLAAWLNC